MWKPAFVHNEYWARRSRVRMPVNSGASCFAPPSLLSARMGLVLSASVSVGILYARAPSAMLYCITIGINAAHYCHWMTAVFSGESMGIQFAFHLKVLCRSGRVATCNQHPYGIYGEIMRFSNDRRRYRSAALCANVHLHRSAISLLARR